MRPVERFGSRAVKTAPYKAPVGVSAGAVVNRRGNICGSAGRERKNKKSHRRVAVGNEKTN